MLRIPRIVIYSRSLYHLMQNCRASSSESTSQISSDSIQKENPSNGHEAKKYKEQEIHLLGPKDKRAPLPGNIGIATLPSFNDRNLPAAQSIGECDLLTLELPEDRHRNVMYMSSCELESTLQHKINDPSDFLECIAQDCPQLIKKDFSDLFPNRDLSSENLTIITLSQKTKNDMSVWSSDVEMEREELMEYFVVVAQDICSSLKNAGYWTDFIDPFSGRPYLGSYTNATLFETDERYRHFGFTIEDLGCCKVISHHLWGTRAFVGCLFTNAPVDSTAISTILKRNKND